MSEETEQEREARKQAEKKARFKRNSVLSVLSNFSLALAIGSVGTGFAKIIADLENVTATQIYTVFAGLAFLGISVTLARMKEPEND